jgi:hypothetical protein
LKGELNPFKVDLSKNFNIILGNVGLVNSAQEIAKGIDFNRFLNFGISYPVQIKFNQNRISVSAEIKDQDNKTIAKITDNQWAVSPDPLLVRDRNYNAYSFEVIDSDLVPILQIQMTGDNTIMIGFSSYGKNGRMIVTQSSGININPSEQAIEEIKNSTLFIYPSSNHLGEMVNPMQPINDPLTEPNRTILLGNTLQIVGIILTGSFSVSAIFDVAFTLKNKDKTNKSTEINFERKNELKAKKKKDKRYLANRRKKQS